MSTGVRHRSWSGIEGALANLSLVWMGSGRGASCALALLGTLAVARAAERDCAALGFTQALRCSSCAKLEALVHDDELHGDCLACCAEDAAGQALLAVRARLEVCQ